LAARAADETHIDVAIARAERAPWFASLGDKEAGFVSDGDPPRRDRRKLAAALEHLSRGLREGEDPLYDPWRADPELPPISPPGQELARLRLADSPLGARRIARATRFCDGAIRGILALPAWALVLLTSLLLFATSAAVLVRLSGLCH
jgi:hypothetical protein